jgi:hypothetical protein
VTISKAENNVQINFREIKFWGLNSSKMVKEVIESTMTRLRAG